MNLFERVSNFIISQKQQFKNETIEFNILSNQYTNVTFRTTNVNEDRRGEIFINETSSEVFTGRGLKPGQHLVIYIKDNTNSKNQYISRNNSIIVKIRNVFTKYLIVDFHHKSL